jgi:hypothetical protein
MRDEMAGDVAAERQLDVIERLLALMPRSRGFRVSTDGNLVGLAERGRRRGRARAALEVALLVRRRP